MTTETTHVRIHIAATGEGSFGECVWAMPVNAEAGIYELDNFPINDVDYTSGDYVQAADNGSGELYVTGLAERRFQPVLLRYGEPMTGKDATSERRQFREHLEVAGCRLEWLMAGLAGVAVPITVSHDQFAALLAAAPFHAEVEEDAS